MSEKKDLTSLDTLFPTTETDPAATPAIDLTPPPVEGLTDLLQPIAPTSIGLGSEPGSFTFSPDPEAPTGTADAVMEAMNLPELDQEIRDLATGGAGSPDLLNPSETANLLEPPLGPDDAPMTPAPSLAETPVGSLIQSALDPTLSQKEPPPGMADLKNYSENLAPSPAAAATPFSLMLVGHLRIHEREALVQILSRENLGIREVELEPQFQAGRILIPRISEYAGVLIVQALRNSGAKMALGPSERIFVSKDAEDEDLIYADNPDSELLLTEDGDGPADKILLSPESSIPNRKTTETLDTLHVSMNLKAAHVGHAQSPVFQDSLEKLKRQLKYQAFHRGADALVSFKYDLHPLEGQTVYKLVVQGTAIRLT